MQGAPHPYQHTLYLHADMPTAVEDYEQYTQALPVPGLKDVYASMYIENSGTKIEQMVRTMGESKAALPVMKESIQQGLLLII